MIYQSEFPQETISPEEDEVSQLKLGPLARLIISQPGMHYVSRCTEDVRATLEVCLPPKKFPVKFQL